jgi:hypothetical protein
MVSRRAKDDIVRPKSFSVNQDVKTTMIYTDVLNRGGLAVRSSR